MNIKLPKMTLAGVAVLLLATFNASGQFSFTNSNNKLSTTSRSGNCVTVVDVNSDGLDDILKMESSKTLVLELQNRDGSFTRTSLGTIPDNSNVWGMAAADVDHNGWKDVAAGSGKCYIYKLFNNGGVITATTTLLPLNYFVQNITFGDFNNDGWADLFVCDDNDYAKVYQNNAGTLAVTSTLINTNINPGMNVGSDPYDSGNYGSVYTDFDNDGDLDLYIAHCRQSASSNSDQRRRDRLFVNDGNNNYTEAAQAYGIEVTDFKQTWTTSFGDLDNDGDMDIVMTNHGENGQILENDGSGHFTDITATTGFSTPSTDPIESAVEDFDNDGFLDILISGGGPGNSYFLYRNNGNKTFTLANTPIPTAGSGMLSFAAGDLNHDGRIDLFASYGNVYNSPSATNDVFYLNTTNNSNHFITFELVGTVSNEGAIGAKASIYGPWGVQVREVRAGESYGTCNSYQLCFGLGASTLVDSVIIRFPSGITSTLTNLAADQFVKVVENSCTITGNIISGNSIICTGQTTTLTAPAGFASYLWQDGSTGQTLTVTQPGSYNVMVTNASGCSAISVNKNVVSNPDETPSVAVTGDLIFCQGGSVTLTSSPASGYTWSDGSTTQAINVTQTGNYAVTIQGVCGNFTSTSIDVQVMAAPAPVVQGAQGPNPSSLTLSATGNNVSWYDQQTGGNLLGTGNTFTTPLLSTSTTYWADEATLYPGPTDYTGMYAHTGTNLYSGNTTNAIMNFTVLNPCTLVSVKVYTDTPGNREIQVLSGTTVVQSALVNVPIDSSRVTLNFPLAPGNYTITTNATVNASSLGFNSPRLRRNSGGVTYPYTITDLVSITGSNQGTGFYYYFYDWEVKEPDASCISARVPVLADITSGTGIAEAGAGSFSIFPNPANGMLNLQLSAIESGVVQLTDLTGRVIRNLQISAGHSDLMQLNLAGVASGTYSVRIISGDKMIAVRKLTVN